MYFSFLFYDNLVHVIVYLKEMIGSDIFIGILQYIFYRSTMHFYR